MKQFDEILHKASIWRDKNKSVALATVVSTWGSSPRPVGSQMAISEDLDILGSVSGGCIEGSVISEAQEIMKTGVPKLLRFFISLPAFKVPESTLNNEEFLISMNS